MTPFAAMQSLCGLSNREAAIFLGVPEKAVEKWRAPQGTRSARAAPPGVLRDLHNLWTVIEQAAIDAAEEIGRLGMLAKDCAAEIEIGYPADDTEAEALGLPCTGAWRQMLGRMIDELMLMSEGFDPARIRLVPRGSTPATAAAADAHNK